MLDNLISLATYELIFVLGILFFLSLGQIVGKLISLEESLINSIIVGLSTYILAGWYTYVILGKSILVIYLLMLISFIYVIFNLMSFYKILLDNIQILLFCFLTSNFVLFPAILILSKYNVIDGAVTLFNADVGAYKINTNVILFGDHDSGGNLNFLNPSKAIIYDASGSFIFIGLFSTFSQIFNGLGLMSALLFANFLLALTIFNFLNALFMKYHFPKFFFYLASLVSLSSSLHVYITGNYFISQLIGLTSTMGTLIVFIKYVSFKSNLISTFLMYFVWGILGLYTYPHFSIFILIFLFGATYALNRSRTLKVRTND